MWRVILKFLKKCCCKTWICPNIIRIFEHENCLLVQLCKWCYLFPYICQDCLPQNLEHQALAVLYYAVVGGHHLSYEPTQANCKSTCLSILVAVAMVYNFGQLLSKQLHSYWVIIIWKKKVVDKKITVLLIINVIHTGMLHAHIKSINIVSHNY